MDWTLLQERLAAAPPTAPLPATHIAAAVLVPIITGPTPSILLTKRAAHLRHHGGQVSFPGGRMDPDDTSPEATALREASEEIGLARANVELVGRMAEIITGTGFRITPVVALLPPGLSFAPDPREVDEVFHLDFSVLLDHAAPCRRKLTVPGGTKEFWVWPHPRHEIWGATAAILVRLARLLRGEV